MTGSKMRAPILMQMMNSSFWTKRYLNHQTRWDIGMVSRPLREYFDQFKDKNQKILIPGAGNAYEAEYLFSKGFKNVYVIDISPEPLKNFKRRVPEFPDSQILQGDFFEFEDSFDLIIEQTFFCAISVEKRANYAEKTFNLLKNNGRIVGLLFKFPLTEDGPPFGGSKDEYLQYFSPYFKIDILEECYNSIDPRQGNELFFKFIKKDE